MTTAWENIDRPPRPWQANALASVTKYLEEGGSAGLVSAIMGAGKSVLTAEMCRDAMARGWQTIVSVPSQALVVQTHAAIAARIGADHVGMYYGKTKRVAHVTVVCAASFPRMAEEPIDIDLWIADEAHGTETDTALVFRTAIAPRRVIGLSATPYRSDDRIALSIFRDLLFEYSAGEAIRDGVLVPWRFPDPPSVVAEQLRNTEAHQRDHSGVERLDLDSACMHWLATRERCIVSAFSIEDAELFAERLVDYGVSAMAVHSRMPTSYVVQRLHALRDRRIQCLVHVDILTEGVDLPWLAAMCLRRRRGSRVRFAQEVGRGLRSAPGKAHCDYFDPHEMFGLHGLSDPARLGDYIRPNPTDPKVDETPFTWIDPITGDAIHPPTTKAARQKIIASQHAVSWLTAASAALRAANVGPIRVDERLRDWRFRPASPAQMSMISRFASTAKWFESKEAEHATPELRDVARAHRAVSSRAPAVRAGVASDLITVIRASFAQDRDQMIETLRTYCVRWPDESAYKETPPPSYLPSEDTEEANNGNT